jgi:hypothetical protein
MAQVAVYINYISLKNIEIINSDYSSIKYSSVYTDDGKFTHLDGLRDGLGLLLFNWHETNRILRWESC